MKDNLVNELGDLVNDCISRQAAIDKFEPWLKVSGYSEGELNMLKAVLYELRFLPSIQPEILACGEGELNVPDTNVGDMIHRQAAIDALDGEIEITGRTNAEAVKGYVRLVKDRLERLPSAQPERKKGKWIDYSDEGYVECPFCHSATNCDGNKDELHFCFSCGADLRGEQDDSISD